MPEAGLMTLPPASICSVSFHRNHTATVRRSQVENPTASQVENEYSQPPRNSQVVYPGKQQRALLRVTDSRAGAEIMRSPKVNGGPRRKGDQTTVAAGCGRDTA